MDLTLLGELGFPVVNCRVFNVPIVLLFVPICEITVVRSFLTGRVEEGQQRCLLLPLQTGLADFQHPAYPGILMTRHYELAVAPVTSGGRSVITVVEVFQAARRTAERYESPAGSLRSPGITQVPRYYEPLRLPIQPSVGYLFPSAVVADYTTAFDTGSGLSGS